MSYKLDGNLPDHPIIRNMEQTGFPNGIPPKETHCPVCGADQPLLLYFNLLGEIVACDDCVTVKCVYDEEYIICKEET